MNLNPTSPSAHIKTPQDTPASAAPQLIDTHCHLHDRSAYDFALSRNRKCAPADYTPEKLLQNAHHQGIAQMICIGTTHADSLAARDFVAAHPGQGLFWSYGIHPEEAGAASKGHERDTIAGSAPIAITDSGSTAIAGSDLIAIADSAPIAIGEVGLDYHTPGYDRPAQIRLLEEMLDLARRLDLPLIFHVRDAFADFWPVVDNAHVQRAVVHSFSDSAANLAQALDRGFYIGVNGLATFAQLYALPSTSATTPATNTLPTSGTRPTASSPSAAPLPPLDRILLETDAPFLAPTPHRGLPNQPAYIRDIAVWLATALQPTTASRPTGTIPEDLAPDQALAEVARATTRNARTLFPPLGAHSPAAS